MTNYINPALNGSKILHLAAVYSIYLQNMFMIVDCYITCHIHYVFS